MSDSRARRVIAVITGTRAEFGLLRSAMWAIREHPELDLRVLVTGAHLLPPQRTIEEVQQEFAIAAAVEMQRAGQSDRFTDAEALGRGIAGFARAFSSDPPDVALVLGDRIEAFAAAAAASVSGIRVAHMHGGDRAEGIADEAMRHAISKLAHIHLPATQKSALRIIAMGEDPQRVHLVGSPAMDGLDDIPPLNDREFAALGSPHIIVLLHPVGDQDSVEYERASKLIAIAQGIAPTLVLHPNLDPGRAGIRRAIEQFESRGRPVGAHARQSPEPPATAVFADRVTTCAHLPREKFIGLLRRAKALIGNSSAGLIECAAIPIRAINVGRRQFGREMPENVVTIEEWDYQTIRSTLEKAVTEPALGAIVHPYGDGRTAQRVANLLATLDHAQHSVRKRNAY